MSALIATAEQVLIDRVLSNKAPVSGKAKAGFSLFALSGFMLAAGLGFLIYGAFIWLTNNYPADIAALMAGGVTLMIALLTTLCALVILKYKQKRIKVFKDDIAQTLKEALDLAGDEVAQPIRENPKTAAVLASLAGYIIGDKLL